MSLPFTSPPPQLLMVDDVLGVEILEDIDTGWQDIRAHLGREHYAGSRASDARHRVVVVPKAVALVRAVSGVGTLEPERFEVVFSRGFSAAPRWRYVGLAVRFEFQVPEPWYGIQIAPRSTNASFAQGWARWQDTLAPHKGYVGRNSFVGLDDLEAMFIAVYGDK